jgi:hypothetical protein
MNKYINTILSVLEGSKKREIDTWGLNVLVRNYQDHSLVPLSELAKDRVEKLLNLKLDKIKRMNSYNSIPSMLQINSRVKKEYGISTLLTYEHIIEVKKDIVPALLKIEDPTYENVKETIDSLTRIVIKLKKEEGNIVGKNAEKLLVD